MQDIMYGRVLEDAMRHTTSGTVSVLEYLTEYAKDSISLIETPPLPASFSCPSPPAPKEIWL